MKKLEAENYYKREWVTKSLIWPDENGYIFKYFKKDIEHRLFSFEKQNSIIEKKKQYFWKFIPETELIINGDGTYCIKQKYIEWKLLKFVDINKLDARVLSDLLELFEGYIAYCKDEWIEMDVIGYQQDIYSIDKGWKRRYLFYSRIFHSFLSSTNIMISSDNNVYMVDVCDVVPMEVRDDKLDRIKYMIRQAIIDLWIRRTKRRIWHLIGEKRKELYGVLGK